jgi:membrane protein DedA with SNARE-associated domain
VGTEALGWCLSIFCWLLFTGVGLPPCPEEAGILYAATVTATQPGVPWWLAWPAASLGILGADGILYGLGRLLGPRLLASRFLSRVLHADHRQRVERGFGRHGMTFLLTARLLPPVRGSVLLLAGAFRYSWLRFLAVDAVYALLVVGAYYFCGTGLVEILRRLGPWAWGFIGVAGLYLAYRIRGHFRAKKQRPAPAAIG